MAQRGDRGRLPDFVGIGAMRSASSWLYRCLVAHPEVSAPARKELHFFSDSRAYGKGIEHYAGAFGDCPLEGIAGEYTPMYMFVPETAARIRRWLPQVRIVACLRDPVERAFSQYKYSRKLQGRLSFYSTFEAAIDRDGEPVRRGLYAEQLERYYALFPPDNILILMYDDVVENPAATLRTLYEFVGVSDTSFIPPRTFERVNPSRGFDVVERVPLANRTLYSLRHRVSAGGALERLAVSSGAAALARRVIRANRSRVAPRTAGAPAQPEPVLQPATAERLYAMYREDGARLRRLLGRDIPWSS